MILAPIPSMTLECAVADEMARMRVDGHHETVDDEDDDGVDPCAASGSDSGEEV